MTGVGRKLVQRLKNASGKGARASLSSRDAATVAWVLERYSEMCSTLQDCAQNHRLGLGGEHLDKLVVLTIDRLVSIYLPFRAAA